jgi:hypothetical protein
VKVTDQITDGTKIARNIVVLGLYFLHSNNVSILLCNPIKKALASRRADTVQISCDYTKHPEIQK